MNFNIPDMPPKPVSLDLLKYSRKGRLREVVAYVGGTYMYSVTDKGYT